MSYDVKCKFEVFTGCVFLSLAGRLSALMPLHNAESGWLAARHVARHMHDTTIVKSSRIDRPLVGL